ncbi:MAG: hypothetical protein M1820_003073 [Bogoriella megaspora]|nr:MAG: hypothetical protein M1820_003073 [Bogoriella megaspora]
MPSLPNNPRHHLPGKQNAAHSYNYGSGSYEAPVNPYSATTIPGPANQRSLQNPRNYDPSSPPPPLPLPTDSTSAPTPPPPPPPPPHRSLPSAEYQRARGYSNPTRQSTTTPGGDNLSEAAAGGGIPGLAVGVANSHQRESGVQALQDIERLFQNGRQTQGMDPHERQFNPDGAGYPVPPPPEFTQRHYQPYQSYQPQDQYDYNSPHHYDQQQEYYQDQVPTPSRGYGNQGPPPLERHGDSHGPFSDTAYNRYSNSRDPFASNDALAPIDPHTIEDDGDDGLNPAVQNGHRRSFLNLGRPGSRNLSRDAIAPAGAIGGAAAGGAMGMTAVSRDASGSYNAVPRQGGEPEKSAWLSKQATNKKKLKWIVAGIIVTIIVLAIVGGVVGAILTNKKNNSSSSSSSDGTSTKSTQSVNNAKGDLSADSPEIKALMNNPNLKKVFPGMDYTPLNAQYPDCLTNPPSQNNITADLAVLSQLTPVVRLYGTDCNQTQMVLHSLSQLNLKPSDLKLWLGVYLDGNHTTNERQLSQMWDIMKDVPKDDSNPFTGVIVGNEVLFSQYMPVTNLTNILHDVKQNLTTLGFNDMPVATSDLGDNWTTQLADAVDVIMANVHPFFAGVTPDKGPGWAWDFWQQHDVKLDKGKKSVVSEIGWPSEGGNDCGTENGCPNPTDGAVASVPNMNSFMEGWVCESMKNGTDYFWFEAFDEPWKVRFNTKYDNWESKWGLMDVNRNLKPGITIPDCGGQRVS